MWWDGQSLDWLVADLFSIVTEDLFKTPESSLKAPLEPQPMPILSHYNTGFSFRELTQLALPLGQIQSHILSLLPSCLHLTVSTIKAPSLASHLLQLSVCLIISLILVLGSPHSQSESIFWMHAFLSNHCKGRRNFSSCPLSTRE